MKTVFLSLRVWSSVCIALLMFAGAMARVSAADILYTGVGFDEASNDLTLGFEFTPSVNITVTHLGMLDHPTYGTGLETAHDIGLWTIAGMPVVPLPWRTISNATATISQDGFLFEPLLPAFRVALKANQTYVLGALYPAGYAKDKLLAISRSDDPRVTIAQKSRGEPCPVPPTTCTVTFPDLLTNLDFRLSTNILFTETLPGDLNLDEVVNAADVLLATQIVMGSETPTSSHIIAGDVAPNTGDPLDLDGQITLADLMLIIQIALGTLTLP